MILLRLAFQSLVARFLTVFMTVIAIALSLTLYLGVEKLRSAAYTSFTDTISQTDLIVGSRTSPVQLLLYSVFRIGNATNNITWESYEDIINRPEVKWAVPISLGDSHKNFRVMGTTNKYFSKYKYRGGQSLIMSEGEIFEDLYDVVLGSDVAKELNYSIGDPLVVAHGLSSFSTHEDQPFKVKGILSKTGTPVDKTVIISLEAIEAIHVDWSSGAKIPGKLTNIENIRQLDLTPKNISGALVGVNSKLQIFKLQRWIDDYTEEPIMAVLPGVALQELWRIVGIVENVLLGISVLVILTTLIGMTAIIFSSLNERRREMAIWRAMGATPRIIIGLLMLESFLISTFSSLVSIVLHYLSLIMLQPWIDQAYGIWINISMLNLNELFVFVYFISAALFISLIPALRAYWFSINDGMAVKI